MALSYACNWYEFKQNGRRWSLEKELEEARERKMDRERLREIAMELKAAQFAELADGTDAIAADVCDRTTQKPELSSPGYCVVLPEEQSCFVVLN